MRIVANLGSEPPAANENQQSSSSGLSYREYMILVAVGAFATTFAQQKALIGVIPTNTLLVEHFKLKPSDTALFWLITAFAWNIKPLAGILTDAFPLFGT